MSDKNTNRACPGACEIPNLQAANENAAVKNTNYRPSEGKSGCEGCALFDISNRMKKCINDNSKDTGYCWSNYFKCKADMTCDAFQEGGPINNDASSEELQSRFGEEALSNQPVASSNEEQQMQMGPQPFQSQQAMTMPPQGMMLPEQMMSSKTPQVYQDGGDVYDPYTDETLSNMLEGTNIIDWEALLSGEDSNLWNIDSNQDGIINEKDSILYDAIRDMIFDTRKNKANEDGSHTWQPYSNEYNKYFDIPDDTSAPVDATYVHQQNLQIPDFNETPKSQFWQDFDKVNNTVFDAYLASLAANVTVKPSINLLNKTSEKVLKNKLISESVEKGAKTVTRGLVSGLGKIFWPLEVGDFAYNAFVKGRPQDYWMIDYPIEGGKWLWDQYMQGTDWLHEKMRENSDFRQLEDNLDSGSLESQQQGIQQLYNMSGGRGVIPWQEGGEPENSEPENTYNPWTEETISNFQDNYSADEINQFISQGQSENLVSLSDSIVYDQGRDMIFDISKGSQSDDGGHGWIPYSDAYSQYFGFPEGSDGNTMIDADGDGKRDIPQEIIDETGNVAFNTWLGVQAAKPIADQVIDKTVKNQIVKQSTKQGVKTGLKNAAKFIGNKVFWPLEVADLVYNVGKGTPEDYWLIGGANWLYENMTKGAYDIYDEHNIIDDDSPSPQYNPGSGHIHGVGTPKIEDGQEYNIREYENLEDYHTAKSQRKGNKLGAGALSGTGNTNITDVFGPLLDTNANRNTHTLYNPTDETMFYDKTDPTRLYNEEDWTQYSNEQLSENVVNRLNERANANPELFQKVTGYDPITKKITYAGDMLQGDIDSDTNPDAEYIGYTKTEDGWSDKTSWLDEDAEGTITAGEDMFGYDPDNPLTYTKKEFPTEAYGGDIRKFFPEFELGSEKLDEYGVERKPSSPRSQMDVLKPITHYQQGGNYETYDEFGNIIPFDNPYLSEESMDTRNYTKDEYDRGENTGGTGWGYGFPGQNLDYVPQSACPCPDGTMSVDCCKEEPEVEDPCPPCNGVVPERVNGDCPECEEVNDEQPCPCPDGTESIECCDETDLGDGDDSAPEKGNFDLGATAVGLIDTLRPINRMLEMRKENKRKEDLKRNQLADNQFTVAGNQESQGDYDVNTGQLSQNKRVRSRQGKYGSELSRFTYQDGGFDFNSSEFTDTSNVADTNKQLPFNIPGYNDGNIDYSHKEYVSGQSYPELINQYNPKGIYTDASYNQGTIDIPNNQKQINAMARTNPVGSLFVGGKAIYDQFTKNKEEVKYGGDILDLDRQTINELIAAGADIELI